MKPDLAIIPTPVDRPATSEEIRAAISLWSERNDELVPESVWEIAADVGGYVRVPSPELQTLRLIEDLLEDDDSKTN